MAANPAGARGLDFSVGNGNNKLSAQAGNNLPLPNLSGKGNGPVGEYTLGTSAATSAAIEENSPKTNISS